MTNPHISTSLTAPKPVTEPLEHRQVYFIANPVQPNLYSEAKWLGKGDANDLLWLRRGLIHLVAGNAIAHAYVMLGKDPHDPARDD